MDCNPLASSVHGISQSRILEWVAIFFSSRSSWPRDQIQVPCVGRWVLYRLSHQRNSRYHGEQMWNPETLCSLMRAQRGQHREEGFRAEDQGICWAAGWEWAVQVEDIDSAVWHGGGKSMCVQETRLMIREEVAVWVGTPEPWFSCENSWK